MDAAKTASAANCPRTLTRAEATALLAKSGKYDANAMAGIEGLADELFNTIMMPTAVGLMKKTKAPAKPQMTEAEKQEIIKNKKITYLKELCKGDYDGISNCADMARHLEIMPEITATFYSTEELEGMGKVAVKKLTRCPITKQYVKSDETDMEVYNEQVKECQFIKNLCQRAAYSVFYDELNKKKNRFTAGNMKKNAAGKLEKMGGKAEKTADELEGQITINSRTKGGVANTKIYMLQKNEEQTKEQHSIRQTGVANRELYRIKNCGAASNQTSILEYTTPYHPTERRDGGCGCVVYMKDVGEFMVEKTGDSEYNKIPQKEALTCMPCFRICNRDVKDGTGKCGTHQRHTSPSKKIQDIADAVDFQLGEEWSETNTEWYLNF